MTQTPPSRPVKVRIAPSPTGDPHIGTAYIALFNALFARKHGGKFVVRIEDTDRSRYRKDSEEQILQALKWLGLRWEEGPDLPDAPAGPYRQSERLSIYREHIDLLVKKQHAYPCFCTAERLQKVRAAQMERKENPRYDGHCRDLPADEVKRRLAQGESHVFRLRMPQEGNTVVNDLLRGEISFENQQIDDQVLLKSDGFPTYHLAVVVDDHLMGISHVIRGEEWISSTPKHIQLYKAFDWPLPVFVHLPLLRNADKSKISKRKNPTNVMYFKEKGVLPEALINFLALMGYHPPGDEEKFTFEDLASSFDASHIHLGGPVFDMAKLMWLNGQYMRELSDEETLSQLQSRVFDESYLREIIPLMKERVECFDEFLPRALFFFSGALDYAGVNLVPKKGTSKGTREIFDKLLNELDALSDWSTSGVTQCFESFLAQESLKPRDVYMPVRLAVTGRKDSPPLFETVSVLGKDRVRQRLRDASVWLKTHSEPPQTPQKAP